MGELLSFTSARKRRSALEQWRNTGWELPDKNLIARMESVCESIATAQDTPEPYEDVYQAALRMLPQWYWLPTRKNRSAFFRGQVHTWPVEPSILRFLPSDPGLRDQELRQRAEQVEVFVQALKEAHADRFTDNQYVAIAQHYGVRTWLLDCTWNPWVALFFASWNGQDNQIGTVLEYRTGEFRSLGSRRSLFGRVRIIHARGIPRVKWQQGIFIEGSHPDVLAQYSPYRTSFNQHKALVFEDPGNGISEQHLFPDLSADALAHLSRATLAKPPLAVFARRMEGPQYRELLSEWLGEREKKLSPEQSKALDAAADFHARVQSIDTQGLSRRSIHQLHSTITYLDIYSTHDGFDLRGFTSLVFEQYRCIYGRNPGVDGQIFQALRRSLHDHGLALEPSTLF